MPSVSSVSMYPLHAPVQYSRTEVHVDVFPFVVFALGTAIEVIG